MQLQMVRYFIPLCEICVCVSHVCVYIHVHTCTHTHMYIYMHTYHLSIDGHLGCVYAVAIVNNTTMNIGVHTFFQISVWGFFRFMPRMESVGHKTAPGLIFWGPFILFSAGTAPVCIPPTMSEGFLFSTSSPALVYWFIDDSHSGRSEVIFHCAFNLHLTNDYWC